MSIEQPLPFQFNPPTQGASPEQPRSSGSLFGKIKRICASPWSMLTLGICMLTVALPTGVTGHVAIAGACLIGGFFIASIAFIRICMNGRTAQNTVSQPQHQPAQRREELENQLPTIYRPSRLTRFLPPPAYADIYPNGMTGHIPANDQAPSRIDDDGLPSYDEINSHRITLTATTQHQAQQHRRHQSLNFVSHRANRAQANNPQNQTEELDSPPSYEESIVEIMSTRL